MLGLSLVFLKALGRTEATTAEAKAVRRPVRVRAVIVVFVVITINTNQLAR